MKKQVIAIHGGDTFDTYEEYIFSLKGYILEREDINRKRWMNFLDVEMGDDFEVLTPGMPNKNNARYYEWKIWFEKLIPFFEDEVVFVGHSLGGIFLAKYFSENVYLKKIKAVFLVSAPFDSADRAKTLSDYKLPASLNNLEKQAGHIFLYHSKDDNVVPFVDMDKYKRALPSAVTKVFENRGHFRQGSFPELVEDIKGVYQI